MAITPLIKKLQAGNRSGIFYAFQSGINDSDLCSTIDNYNFTFSRYALLKIPDFKASNCIAKNENNEFDMENALQFRALGNSVLGEGEDYSPTAGINKQAEYLAESFQNYCLNLETTLLSQETYQPTVGSRTVAERVFFKWLKEMGCMRFQEAPETYVATNVETQKFTEVINDESLNVINYDTVVKYINDIQAVYSNTTDVVSTEIYIYVPTDQGSTQKVLFDSIEDENYHSYDPENGYNEYTTPYNKDNFENFLCGRTSDYHPEGLKATPFYDNDSDQSVDVVSEVISSDGDTKFWFTDPSGNAYFTDKKSNFSKPTNQLIKKTYKSSIGDDIEIEYVRNTLDGISIDWNVEDYRYTEEDGLPNTTFNDINSSRFATDFKFNAILIYYDLTDMKNPNNTITNLYGVYFVNELEVPSDGVVRIINDVKYVPSVANNISQNGTALAYKINFKTDTSFENAGVQRTINTRVAGNYNTFSMDLFVDALTAMQTMVDSYNKNREFIEQTYEDVKGLRRLFIDSTNYTELEKRLDKVENAIVASKAYFNSSDEFMKLLNNVYDDYQELIEMIESDQKITLEYKIDKGVINSVVTHNQAYNIKSSEYKFDFSKREKVIPLNKYSNYIKHESDDLDIKRTILSKDLNLFIDDSVDKWTAGQSFRVVFGEEFSPANSTVNIYTDASAVFGTAYDVPICQLTEDDFKSSDYMPIFEIVCIDPVNFIFEVDKIR